ncbi:Bacterioopsin transcriptional activator [Flagellimonas maritima]|uniref:Bacterioopsin transcriptional activator n=1 Tax=Flagellimonas maritima TaxID=1383885 RepID=A0A2Z4LR49_9FLAO|nr:PAS domain-containing protein [Allomuricauda aurantiaca]AWX44345.1 Bacterioopsin transcriptional activator [Allomuricauda aurantiaca]
MEKTKFYDEAVNNFYRDKEINSYPITSLDIYAQHFSNVCSNLQDAKKLSDLAKKEKWQNNITFRNEILDKERVVVVTDTNLNIVYATQNIFKMNGYTPSEILGKKPKIFQGEATCKETSKEISKAIKGRKPFEVTLTNYRKDGTLYKCWIKGSPVFDISGKMVNFIAYEKEVA